jgi:Protein of unknown function (DUF3592)
MIRRFFSVFLTFQMVILSIICLALTIFLVSCVLTGDPAWKMYALSLGFALMIGGTWYLLKGEIVGADGHGKDAVQPPLSAQPESNRPTRWRKVPGFDPIRRFIQWFWRIGGLDDVKRPLWLTPFGGWFIVFLSLPLLISATVIFIRSEVFLHRSIASEGTVIRLVADHDETVHYAPVFAYTARDGQKFVVQSNITSAPPEFSVGQKVPILYDSVHPERVRIAAHGQIHGLEETFGLIGAVFAGIGFGSLLYQRRRKRQTTASMVAG